MDDTPRGNHTRSATAEPPIALSGDGRRTAGLRSAPSPASPVREGAAMAHAAESNRLLRALPLEDYDHLLGLLVPVRLRWKQVLTQPNVPIADVYFVREGVVSMIATEQDGGDIEIGTVGNEGFVGLPVLLGDDMAANRVFMQVEGDGWRMGADAFRRVLDERPTVRRLCLRYASYFIGQLSQSVACNRLHTVEERCARWLLMTHDRVPDDTFELTHEFLALMLGVRRAGVTVAMGVLQRAGPVRYNRGRITIVDREQLEAVSCSCYGITRTALVRLLGAPGELRLA